MINDLWYNNAVIYCLSVGTFMDSNGDGVGDFKGLVRRLDYLHGLGVTSGASNVAAQRRDKGSMYRLHRRLIGLRRERTALSLGGYKSVRADGNPLLFTRELGRERILVALNFGGEATTARFASDGSAGLLLLSSAGDREDEPIRGNIELRPHEGIVVEVRTPVE